VEGHVEPLGEDVDDMAHWEAVLADYRPSGNLEPAVVFALEEQAAWAWTAEGRVAWLPWEKLSWARRYVDDNHLGPELERADQVLKVGDVIYVAPAERGCSWLAKKPTVAGALVSLVPGDGRIEALVGGFDFYDSKFNRVTQAKRQPGSSFKPFIYTAALDKGYTAATIINDAPVVFEAPGLEDTWRPENYSGHFYGPTRLRQALIPVPMPRRPSASGPRKPRPPGARPASPNPSPPRRSGPSARPARPRKRPCARPPRRAWRPWTRPNGNRCCRVPNPGATHRGCSRPRWPSS